MKSRQLIYSQFIQSLPPRQTKGYPIKYGLTWEDFYEVYQYLSSDQHSTFWDSLDTIVRKLRQQE